MSELIPAARVVVPDGVRGGVGLSTSMRVATRAIAGALFATEDGAPPDERLDWLCDELDDFFAHAGGRSRALFRLCITAVTWLGPLHARRLGAFHALDFDTRALALERMERGPAGTAVFGAKALLCIVWYEHPEVARRVGFDGGCLKVVP